jgi:PAS domain S-box-containing protein
MLMAGSVSGRVWSFRDITERKRAEQELLNMMDDMRAENDARKQAELVAQREEALSNTIIDSIPGAFFLLDENGKISRSNSYHRDAILCMTGDQVTGMNAIDTIHPEDRALIQSKMVNVLQDGKDEMAEGRVLLRGGPDYIWMLLTGRRLMINGRPFLVGTGIDITERNQAETALRIKENQYRELFESGADALFLIVISTGKIIDANKMASVLYGYERDELLTKLSTELSAESDETTRRIQDALNKPGKIFNIPLRLHRKKDGTVFPVEITARSFLKDGEPVILVSSRDITERKRVEAELHAEKINSEAMFESSPIALFVLDDKTNIVRVNGRAVVMFGGCAAAALQHRPGNALGCVHSSEDPRGCGYSPNCPLCPVRNGIESLLANGGEINGVDVALDLIREGVPQKVWMEIGAKFVQIEGRRHVCIAMVDITARKQADAALEKQNTLLTALLNNLQMGVFMVEVPSGKPLLANQASYNLLGRGILPESHASTLAKVYDIYKSDTNEPYPNDELPIVVAMKGVTKHVDDLFVVKPDGTRVDLEVFGSPIKDSQGNIWASLVSFQDISARKQAEVAIVKLAKVKSKFTSVVSHELRSPLATIKEATNLVLEGVLGPVNNEQKDMLSTAKTNIDRLSRLVNDVLTYQKMDTGKMLYDFQKNAVNEVVREASKSAVLFAGERKKDLVVELGENLPEIIFDKDKILQVMVNLIANGIKYSESGPVVIKTCLKNSEIQFSVQDSGQGVLTEETDEIFKPFSHGKGRKKGGTGLGLAISKEIVLAHQGRIWVESEIGKGSTFHFTLPVEDTGKI